MRQKEGRQDSAGMRFVSSEGILLSHIKPRFPPGDGHSQ